MQDNKTNKIIQEAKGIRSKKIYDIIKQHKGISKDDSTHRVVDLHNLTDNDVIGIIPSYQELNKIQAGHTVDHGRWAENYGLDVWAKGQGFNMDRGDRVEAIRLADGTFLAVAVRNEELIPDRDGEGWANYYKKSTEREKNRRADGKYDYVWQNKDAREILKNPYFKKWPQEHRQAAIDKARAFRDRLHESISEKLAAARSATDTNPTEGQKKANNYAHGTVRINGFQIKIENPKGSYRCGKDKGGKEWKTLMHHDYGYFSRTLGKDGDAIDVFIGPNLDSKKIFAIDQKINGKFDETKVMFCFNDVEQAKNGYLSNYEKDWKGFWKITEVDLPTFKKWLYDGYKQRKPFFDYVEIKSKKLNETKTYNVNMDLDFAKEGRTAPNISVDEFYEHVKDFYLPTLNPKFAHDAKKIEEFEKNPDKKASVVELFKAINHNVWHKKGSNLDKDLNKIKHDWENCNCIGDIRTTKDGIPYIMGNFGGDWEDSILFMVYWDGKEFRGYIPEKGNRFNRDTNEAFGNNEEADKKFIMKNVTNNDGDYSKIHRNLTYNKDICIKDFESRIKAKKGKLNESISEKDVLPISKELSDIIEKHRHGKTSKLGFGDFKKDKYGTWILDINGGLNGWGEWDDYFADILDVFNALSENFMVWVVDLDVDVMDDTFTLSLGVEDEEEKKKYEKDKKEHQEYMQRKRDKNR